MKKSLLVLTLLLLTFASADEGMYPISEIRKLDLQKLGFEISPTDLYNPNGVSLIDAIVRVGGCTGSFISTEGLVITNHHCVFGAVQAISTAEKDYITDGFIAPTRDKEVLARGLTIRITESYTDVSADVLSAVTDDMPLAERSRAISKKMRDIAQQAEKEHEGRIAEVSEMFAGRTYVLFLYQTIKDVRIVYVPPRSIGEFGGENDNWVWPRHTGDFSFVRAYVAPDGTPAEYAEDNVPYTPRRILKVNPKGVDDGDFVFILGYPGRTFRHQPAAFVEYEENVRMPFIADWFEWQIRTMEDAGKTDRAIAIKFDSRIKGLANVMKNYRGKLTGLDRLHLVSNKREEEKKLQAFIDADSKRKATYGTVLGEFDKLYANMTASARRELVLGQITRSSLPLSIAYSALRSAKKEGAEEEEGSGEQLERTINRLKESFRDYHQPTDMTMFAEMLRMVLALPEGQKIEDAENLVRQSPSVDAFVRAAYESSDLTSEEKIGAYFGLERAEIEKQADMFVKLAIALEPEMEKLREMTDERNGALNKLLALYVDVKEQFTGQDFIPDANRTLRLTFGRIKGYSPADATYYTPISTLQGVLEKTTGEEPYNTPEKLLMAAKEKRKGMFYNEKLKDIPVGILYNTDTTGGNSGSPVMNARGELIGVNFDRAYHATINDFAWSDSYSRSIAVDIRYVLWVTKYVGGAGFILEEIGIQE